MLGLMYVWFSRSTQHSVEVHSVEWCMAKEAARSMMVMQWSRDLGWLKEREGERIWLCHG